MPIPALIGEACGAVDKAGRNPAVGRASNDAQRLMRRAGGAVLVGLGIHVALQKVDPPTGVGCGPFRACRCVEPNCGISASP
ncbi:hypothetical protein BQ8794_30078 [Mesorhizobium prunaredense]|uniref:Uncharacterized protein n=1 Tax=Mesorhizobium prunaredense TaxID=1631249 RepID=A0A1R3V9S4_9HYPH|nr:hypothetical protein BQ8794_30078 [Mesorhizobium prunaredense]